MVRVSVVSSLLGAVGGMAVVSLHMFNAQEMMTFLLATSSGSIIRSVKNATAVCSDLFRNQGIEPLQSHNNKAWKSHRCDELFCRNVTTTSTNVCQWSTFALDLLLADAHKVCTPEHVEEFLVDPQWNIYRFSDYLMGVRRGGVAEVPQKFSNSIIAQMNPNITIPREAEDEATRVVAQRLIQMTASDQQQQLLLQPGTLVIHLRLGDVIEGHRVLSVRDLLSEQQYFWRQRTTNGTSNTVPCDPWNPKCINNPPLILPDQPNYNIYVQPLSYYSSLPINLQEFHSVIIMGAAHQGNHPQRTAVKSCHYTHAIYNYFQRRMPHASIRLQVGKFPDEDILTAAQATRFVVGAGGFSRRLDTIQKRFHTNSWTRNNKSQPQQLSFQQTACKDMFMNQGMEPLSSRTTTATWNQNECDHLFCQNITGGVCHWSNFAIDSLLENATNVCNVQRIEEFFLQDSNWKDYNFFDYVQQNVANRPKRLQDIPEKFPSSIIAAMMDHPNATASEREKEANQIIAKRIEQIPEQERIQPGTLVIHLRLGDVVDGPEMYSVEDFLLEETYFFRQRENGTTVPCDPWNPKCLYNPPLKVEYAKYVKPLSYYSSLLLEQGEDLDQYHSVIIMGAARIGNYRRQAVRSCHYTRAIYNYFKRRMPHASVSLQLGRFQDEVILTAAQATRFISGGGRFTKGLQKIHKSYQERQRLLGHRPRGWLKVKIT